MLFLRRILTSLKACFLAVSRTQELLASDLAFTEYTTREKLVTEEGNELFTMSIKDKRPK